MSSHFLPPAVVVVAHVLIVLVVGVRVIMRRPVRGVALAWLFLAAMLPFAGGLAYLLVGERRIGRRRSRGLETLHTDFRKIAAAAIPAGLTDVAWARHSPAARSLDCLGRTMVGSPTVRGSRFELFADAQVVLKAIAHDVDDAKTSVLMEFYIWNEGGAADVVLDALIRAAQRGVRCRVLVDALGARPWWRGPQPQRLREAGVELREALPVGLLRSLVGRTDLRLHRKIVVVDGEVAWTGSMNLVDPAYFKADAGVGEWVDAMVRLEGAIVVPLGAILIGDWLLETGEPMQGLIRSAGLHLVRPQGSSDIQAIPSGPGEGGDGLLQMLLALIGAAQNELVLTTPYMVPDDALILALRGAAGRGVKVTVIVPEKVDSLLTRYASRSYYDDLLDVGVELQLYRGGLLHTKSILVDDAMSMFGTVNFDMRSLWLNYEVALFAYGPEFAQALRALQQAYLAHSVPLDRAAWSRRPLKERVLENVLRLFSPLL
jgi:cardiolipin synthase A/B